VEFKREAFKLYDELRQFIRHQVATTIFRVNVQVQQPASAPPPPRNLPMPTPQQMAMLRAAAAARAQAAQLASGTDAAGSDAPAASGNGAAPSVPPSDDTPSDMIVGDDAIVETQEVPEFGDELDLDAQDLAPYDEISGDDAAPGFVDAAAAAVPISAQAIVPGLAPKPARQMTLQHGDEPVETKPASSAAGGPGARLGRNDPCYCGSGLKYKKCHGK